jgi:UDP-N-acetylglucosamine 1-carboxyvinyltransferase
VIEMLRALGAGVEFSGNTMIIDPRTVDNFSPPYELSRQMRASYYLAPVLLGLFSRAEVPMPGGCDIGARPIDQTIKGMTTLGADVRIERGTLLVSTEGLHGAEVYLDIPRWAPRSTPC